MDVLNDDCLSLIFKCLSLKEKGRYERVSKRWKKLMYRYQNEIKLYELKGRNDMRLYNDKAFLVSFLAKINENIEKIDLRYVNQWLDYNEFLSILQVIGENCPNLYEISIDMPFSNRIGENRDKIIDALISFGKMYGNKLRKIELDKMNYSLITNEVKEKIIEFLSYCPNLEDVAFPCYQVWLKEDTPHLKTTQFLPKLKRIKIIPDIYFNNYQDIYPEFLSRPNNIRYLKRVIDYQFTYQMQQLIPQLAPRMSKLEVARFELRRLYNEDEKPDTVSDNRLKQAAMVRHVTNDCRSTLKSIGIKVSMNDSESGVYTDWFSFCPNVTKLDLSLTVDMGHNWNSYAFIDNLISSFPNLIKLQITALMSSYDGFFDGLSQLNKLQSIRLEFINTMLRWTNYEEYFFEVFDSLLLSLLTSCPHLSYMFISGFKQINCETLDAIIEIAKARPMIDLVIDVNKNISSEPFMNGEYRRKRSSDISKYYAQLSLSEDGIPKNLRVICECGSSDKDITS